MLLKEQQAQHPAQKLEVWFGDEARFGQQGTVARVWHDRGQTPVRKRQRDYQWLYLMGAVCPERGDSLGWIMPCSDTWAFNFWLKEFGQHLPAQTHALLIIDNAGWHHAKALRVPDNVTLAFLPAYSPELNPVELIWRYMRQQYMSNRVFPEMVDLDKALGDAWIHLSNQPDRIRSISQFPWLLPTTQQEIIN